MFIDISTKLLNIYCYSPLHINNTITNKLNQYFWPVLSTNESESIISINVLTLKFINTKTILKMKGTQKNRL